MEHRQLQEKLDNSTRSGICPGCVLLVSFSGGRQHIFTSGYHTFSRTSPVKHDDIFDIASLTKVVATTSVALSLVNNKTLDLDASVGELMSSSLHDSRQALDTYHGLTARHLLAHCSGLPAYKPFWTSSTPMSRSQKRQAILHTVPLSQPGMQTVYSDIGMMVLGFLLETVAGMPLDHLAKTHVFTPLNMENTAFIPHTNLPGRRAVPTECRKPGTPPLTGDVHDENAGWLGGVSGHAGLFSTAADVASLADCIRDGGLTAERQRIWREDTIRLFTRRAGLVEGSSRCLGWDGYSPGCVGGELASMDSFGHTGFTGTSLWVDPEKKVTVVLLTNAIHPHRTCKSKGYFEWRREIHTLAYELDR